MNSLISSQLGTIENQVNKKIEDFMQELRNVMLKKVQEGKHLM